MKKSSKEESIFKAALKLFIQKGFHGTATLEIAKEAKVSNGTLFNYFETKDQLIHKLYRYLKNQLHKAIEDIDLKLDLENILYSLWKNTLLWAMDHQDEFFFIKQYVASPFAKSSIIKEAELEFTNLDIILSKAPKSLSKNQSLILIESFKSNIQGALTYSLNSQTNEKKIDNLKVFFNIWWNGIEKNFFQ